MTIRHGFWTSYPGLAVRLTLWAAIGFVLGLIFAVLAPFMGAWQAVDTELDDFHRERDEEERNAMLRPGRRLLAERARVLIGDLDADTRESEGL